MKVTERYTPMSPYHLQYEATIEDPLTFTEPWTISMPLYRRMEDNAQLMEFRCVEFVEEVDVRRVATQPAAALVMNWLGSVVHQGQANRAAQSRSILMLAVCCLVALPLEASVDLSGTYNVATLTPLERPKMFGDKQYLSRAEADKIRAQDAAAKAERNQLSDPDRGAPPSGGDGSAGAAGNVGGIQHVLD
jgi:hypothetical protein